jgi:acyl-CoA synthetase (AMP-forming)/AMP-acid ligase II
MDFLYEKWQAVVAERNSGFALRDRVWGKTWTFAELAAAVDEIASGDSWRVTRAGGSRLILETLASWRDGAVFCPLEADSPAPPIERAAELPTGVMHVKLTSGSTGEPRGVLFRAEQLAADAENIVATMGLRPEWPNLGVISLTHSYGFSNLVLPLLLHGIPLDWLGDPLPGAVAGVLAEDAESPLTLAAVPAMWRAWHAAGALEVGPERVKLAISAGAPLPGELERRIFQKSRIKVHNFYGSSECGGIAYDRSEVPRESREVIGAAMENVDLSVNEEGCLVVDGPAVGEGYWPAASSDRSEGITKGRFVTSDLAELRGSDREGDPPLVALSGRRDDLINVAGRKVSPPRVEAAILREDTVQHCVVFGVSSSEPSRVEDTVAVIAPMRRLENDAETELASSVEFDLDDLKKRIAGRLQRHESPRRWWLCEDLKPDRRGKFSRSQWRERYLDHIRKLTGKRDD